MRRRRKKKDSIRSLRIERKQLRAQLEIERRGFAAARQETFRTLAKFTELCRAASAWTRMHP